MDGKSNLRYFALLVPAAIVALDLLFFYLDDYLDEGRSIFFLDTYGQGYFTWWLDFERFWGNFELWSLGIGVWMGFFAAFAFGANPGALGTRKATLVKWPLALLVTLLVFAGLAGLANWFSPAPYSIGAILAQGWYTEYFPSNVLFLLVAFSGVWLLIPALSKLRRGRNTMPLSPRMAASLLIPAIVMLHLALASVWSVPVVNNLQTSITSLIGLLFVTTPLFAFMVSSAEQRASQEPSRAGEVDEVLNSRRKLHSWLILVVMISILGGILVALEVTTGIDTGIDIASNFVPRNFLTWVTTALVATITFVTIQGGQTK